MRKHPSIAVALQFSVLLWWLLALVASDASAVRPYHPVRGDPVLEPWRWRSFPELSGLGLRCMAESGDGAMLFGVDEGVVHYDGVNWTTYTPEDGLLGAPVNVLCASRDGSVYAGTEMGISQFGNGAWRRVFPPEGDLPWYVNSLMEAADGSLWAGTAWGGLRIAETGTTLYTSAQMGDVVQALASYVGISSVVEAVAPVRLWSQGTGVRETIGTWIGMGRGNVPAVIWALASGGPGEAAGLRVGDAILSIDGHRATYQEQQGGQPGTSVTLAIRRREEIFDVTLTREKIEGTFRDFSVFDIFEAQNGTLWFGLASGARGGGEVVSCDSGRLEDPAAWRLYTVSDGVDAGYGPRLAQTRDGTIWKVSHDGRYGVSRFDGKKWTCFDLDVLGNTAVCTAVLVAADGTFWIGGHKVVYAFRHGKWSVYARPDAPIPASRARLLEASDGALWIAGLGQEAARLDYRTARWETYEGLNYQCETLDGAQWFLSEDDGAVRYDGQAWVRFGKEDGLMNAPVGLLPTRSGEVWAAGSQDTIAATARFDGKKWSLQLHSDLSWGIGELAFCEAADGSLWFGASGTFREAQGQSGGLLRLSPEGNGETARLRYIPPEVPGTAYGIEQTADGNLWICGWWGLRRFDGKTWTLPEEQALSAAPVDVMQRDRSGGLWAGTRTYGIYHYDGRTWTRYSVQDGLPAGRIRCMLQADDGSVWAAVGDAFCRFDGRTWSSAAFPPSMVSLVESPVFLRQSRDGTIWLNLASPGWYSRAYPDYPAPPRSRSDLQAIAYMPDVYPPETRVTVFLDKVSQPGNTTLAWEGVDRWNVTPKERLLFSYRIDREDWAPFTRQTSQVFFSLPSGTHTFEVKARDLDSNEDPTPAVMMFTVIPPVWQQPWFVGLVAVLAGVAGLQTARVIWRDRRLQRTNVALEEARSGLEQRVADRTAEIEQQIRRQGALLRISQAVQEMKHPSDLEQVVQVCYERLRGLGLEFQALAIQRLIDETNSAFEFYEIQPSGELYRMTATSPNLYRAWKSGKGLYRPDLKVDLGGLTSEALDRICRRYGVDIRCILNVLHIRGILSLLSAQPNVFSESEIRFVEQVADVLSVGIARAEDLERLEAQNRALQESEDRFRRLSQASFEGILITERGRALDANDQLAKMFGYELTEITGMEAINLIASESRVLVSDRVRTGYEGRYEFLAIRKDGSRFPVEAQGKVISYETRTVRVSAIRDISERKQAEQEMVRLERLRALGEMSAGVSHNLNNILTGVLGPAQILKLLTDDPKILRETDTIITSAIRARDLVSRLHRAVRGIEETAQPVRVHEVVQEAVQAARPRWKDEPEARGISIEVVTDGKTVPPIAGTPSGLHDVLINLIFNAVDAMPEGGTIHIAAEAGAEEVRLTVRDTGIGMDEATRQQIFEPFFTTKLDVGTGLGLSTAHGTLTRWGGRIEVESAPGKGTTFTVCLPVCRDQGAVDETVQEVEDRSVRHGRILVVDDDDGVREVLVRMLSGDHDVDAAADGPEGLKRLAENDYDVVFVDLGMPGMAGDRFAREAQAAAPSAAQVLISGWELAENDPRRAPFALLLQKPFEDASTVRETVARAIRIRDARTEN